MGDALAVLEGGGEPVLAVRRDLMAAILSIEDDAMLVNGRLSPEIEDWLRQREQ